MPVSDEFDAAVRLHQQGQLQSAAQAFQAILARTPDHVEALHRLGIVAVQLGDSCRAIALLRRAVQLAPTSAAMVANLGEAYRVAGQLDQAAQCCQEALRLQPGHAGAANNLGMILLARGDAQAAVEQFRTALTTRPDSAILHNNLGNALRLAENIGEALQAFRQAVQRDPQFAEAHGNLGQLLLEANQPREALAHCEEAVRLRPHVAELHNNLGNVLRDLGRFADARASYREALRLSPNLAQPRNNMGQVLQEEGDLRGALAWYRQALQLDPHSPRIHANLASAFEEQGHFGAAAERYRTALQLDPAFAEAHNGLGFVLHQQGNFAEAMTEYREVIRLRPSFALGHCNLGNLLEELGDFKEAEAGYRTALSHDPNLAVAHAQLATLLRGKLPDDDLAALRRALDRPDLPIARRLALHFGLAHALDGRGEYREAAEHMRSGNALCQKLWQTQGQAYDPQAHTAFVDRLMAACTPEFFARTRDFGSDDERPVFIVGLPRSGTTLTEQVLASHPKVFGAGELNYIKEDFDALPALLRRSDSPVECLAGLDRATAAQLAGRHLDRLGALDATALRVVDKMPDNYLYLGLIAVLFPRARIVYCRRDLRDVAVSCWMTHFRHIRWASDLEHIAARFADHRRIMEHWRRVLPLSLLEVDYEETVADLEGVARRLVAWCGLDWDPACLEFHKTTRPVRTASVSQVRQPIYGRSVARWKHYETELAPLFAALADHEPRP
jgi:Flp pilus assembly protein TadD